MDKLLKYVVLVSILMFNHYFCRLGYQIGVVSGCGAIAVKKRKNNSQIWLLCIIQTTEVNVIGVHFGCLFNNFQVGALSKGLFLNPL